MKKVVSMLSIVVRSSLYKIWWILAGMILVQLGVFYQTYQRYAKHSQWEEEVTLGTPYGVTWTLESLVEESYVEVFFLIAFVLICVVLTWSQGERRGVQSYYFYERMSVSQKQRFFVWTGYNISIFLLFAFAELLAVLGMGDIFTYLVPQEYESVQMYFMAFYKSPFLHGVFPMGDILRWIRNILMVTACGMEIAGYACRKRKPWALFILIVLILFGFSQRLGDAGMDYLLIVASVCYIGAHII